MTTFNYIDGLCGSGKTHAISSYIDKNKSRSKNIICVPTSVLVGEYAKTLPYAKPIDNQLLSGFNTVQQMLLHNISAINKIGYGTIITTQASFNNNAFFEDKKSWNLIIDEIPAIDAYSELSLPYHHSIFSDYIDVDTTNALYSDLYPLSLSKKGINVLNQSHDDVNGVFKKLMSQIQDGKMVYTYKSSYHKVLSNIVDNDESDGTASQFNKLHFLSLTTPKQYDGFNRTIIAGAHFTQSMLYGYFTTKHNVNFEVFEPIQKHLRYQQHTNKTINIMYQQTHNASKRSRDYVTSSGITSGEYMEADINKYMSDKGDFLFVVNNDYVSKTKINGKQIPVISHGINSYSSYTNIAFTASLNRKPIHTKMLIDATQLDNTYINRASCHEISYQCVMRTALRDPSNSTPINIIVTDKENAENLARCFESCDVTIGALFGMGTKIKKAPSFNRQHRTSELKLKTNKIVNGIKTMSPTSDFFISTCGDISKYNYVEYTNFDSRIELISQLKHNLTHSYVTTKNQEILFNLTQYTDNKRGLANSARNCGIILDIDNGDMSVEDVKNVFTKANLSFLVFSTFSTGLKQSYRVIVWIDRNVDNDEYKKCHKFLRDLCAKEGFLHSKTQVERNDILAKNPNAKFSGIDNSKCHTESFFYLPAKVIGREDAAFFYKHNCKDEATIQRHSLQVDNVLALQVGQTHLQPILQVKPVTTKSVTAQQICDNLSWNPGDYHASSVKAGARGALSGIDIYDMQQEVRSRVPDNFKHHERNVKWGYTR
jgi:hypothetical protein